MWVLSNQKVERMKNLALIASLAITFISQAQARNYHPCTDEQKAAAESACIARYGVSANQDSCQASRRTIIFLCETDDDNLVILDSGDPRLNVDINLSAAVKFNQSIFSSGDEIKIKGLSLDQAPSKLEQQEEKIQE